MTDSIDQPIIQATPSIQCVLFSGNRPKSFVADQQSRQHAWVCVWQRASIECLNSHSMKAGPWKKPMQSWQRTSNCIQSQQAASSLCTVLLIAGHLKVNIEPISKQVHPFGKQSHKAWQSKRISPNHDDDRVGVIIKGFCSDSTF